ncbi:MAG TPA: HAD-IA family hydrolase, partial [Acidimicrobiales bacterium]|nr:HAD-IA family hydrolase [Acidimicrobiales bacterium]
VSGLEGLAKPDPAIFELLFGRFGLHAGATLFVDDNAENVAAASVLGMSTVLFESSEALRRALGEMDLLPGGP